MEEKNQKMPEAALSSIPGWGRGKTKASAQWEDECLPHLLRGGGGGDLRLPGKGVSGVERIGWWNGKERGGPEGWRLV